MRDSLCRGLARRTAKLTSAWYSGKDKAALHHSLSPDINHLPVSLPLSQATAHLLGKEEFEIFSKPNAFVTNTARGEIICAGGSKRSSQCIRERYFRHPWSRPQRAQGSSTGRDHAGTTPKDDPLWDAPDCIITPHMSGISKAYSDRALQVLEISLERRAKGQSLMNLIQRRRGFMHSKTRASSLDRQIRDTVPSAKSDCPNPLIVMPTDDNPVRYSRTSESLPSVHCNLCRMELIPVSDCMKCMYFIYSIRGRNIYGVPCIYM